MTKEVDVRDLIEDNSLTGYIFLRDDLGKIGEAAKIEERTLI
jgi:hypothetical protein